MAAETLASEEGTPNRTQQGKQRFVVFCLLVGGVVALTWPTWVGLVGVWSHQFGYSHGFLVAPIAIWLVWRALHRSAARLVVPATSMLGVVGLLSFLWLFLLLASIRTLEEAVAAGLLWTTATAVLGWRLGKALLFPIGYLLFAIPIWEGLAPVLQPLTSTAAATICQVLSIPTHLEGNVVHIPNGVFSIAEGCAGSHYFLSAITLAALYGHLEYRRLRSSLALIALAATLAIVSNWLRVVLVIRAGYVTGMHHPWIKDHNMVGWALFALALLPLFAVARRLEAEPDVERTTGGPGQSRLADAASPRRIAIVSVAALALIGLPGLLREVLADRSVSMRVLEVPAPAGRFGWTGPMAPDVDWTPAFPSADAVLRVAYEGRNSRITLFRAGYAEQKDGREVINYDNRIQGGEGWTPTQDSATDIPGLGRWRRSMLEDPAGRRRVVLYRYTIAGRPTTSRLEAKIRQGWKGIFGYRSASILAVSMTCGDSCQAADDHLVRFLEDMQIGIDAPAGHETEVTGP